MSNFLVPDLTVLISFLFLSQVYVFVDNSQMESTNRNRAPQQLLLFFTSFFLIFFIIVVVCDFFFI